MEKIHDLGTALRTVKDLLTKTSTSRHLALPAQRKAENVPTFIRQDKELYRYYNQTDLEYEFVVMKCAELDALKRENIPVETMILWYMEFIRLGWSKEKFLERLEAVKRVEKFGGIEFNHWIRADLLYTQTELERAVQQRINFLAKQGEAYYGLLIKGFALTDDELKSVLVYAAEQLMTEYERQTYIRIDQEIDQAKRKEREIIHNRSKKIRALTEDERRELATKLLERSIINSKATSLDLLIKYLPDFAFAVPDEFLEELEGVK